MRTLALIALLFTSSALAGATLEGATDALEVVTTSTSAIDYTAVFSNVTATALTTPGTSVGQITTATTTTIIAAPAASNWRYIRFLRLRNSGSATNTVTVQIDRSASNRTLWSGTLAAGASVLMDDQGQFQPYLASGTPFSNADAPGFTGKNYAWGKTSTAVDATGYHYLSNKDNGFPGAWSVGTPGVNGVVTACDVVGTAGTGGALSTGSPVLPDPATGGWYLTRFGVGGAAAVNTYALHDIVWYNTGLTVTTTTSQGITSPAFPARDNNGSTDGEGYQIALYALTALGNAAAVSNTTVQYTNSAGTAGRNATFTGTVGFQAPATPVIGTWMPFQLQAGDTGVRSIQGITLNTTYTSGTMMLIVYRTIALDGVALANGPSGSLVNRNVYGINPGIRVWNDTCFAIGVLGAPATTAPNFSAGSIELMER